MYYRVIKIVTTPKHGKTNKTGRLKKLIILGTQDTSNTPANVNITVSILINGRLQDDEYRNEPRVYVITHDIDIPVSQGDILGLRLNTRRNRKGFTVLIEQEVEE